MLSFMREQNEAPKCDKHTERITAENAENTEKELKTNSAVSVDSAVKDKEYVTVATRRKQVRKTTRLLIVLFCLGLLCLWFMIKKSAPPLSAVADSKGGTGPEQIGTAITRLIGVRSEMFNRMGEIVKKFYQFSDVQQVNVNELVKNPFELKAEYSMPDDGYSTRVENQVSSVMMQLLSIMHSDQGNCCMIDDRILYEGDSIRDFKVRQISDSEVLLEAESEGTQIVLRLSE